MEPIPPISNANGIANIATNANGIPKIGIEGPSIIPTIEPPIVRSTEVPVVRGLALPVFQMPDPSIKYPVIDVPTQEEFDAAAKAEREKQAAEKEEKTRGLPDPTPPPQLPPVVQTPPPTSTPTIEVPPTTKPPTFTINGVDINLPDPSLVATAGSVAVVTTASTMVATTVFNTLKNAAEPLIKEATKKKFKVKIKQVKPVLHYVLAEGGHIDVFEYSANGTRLVEQVDNVEQYIRDQVEINSLYEIDNKIIIDDVIAEKFTKEGQQRFKPLFAPAKKIAKKLSAKFSI
jgi:hypothetical protein